VLDGVYGDELPPDADGAPIRDGTKGDRRALPEGSREVAWPGRSGIIQDVDVPRIIAAARSADAAVEIVVPTGERVHQRATVAVIHGSVDPSVDEAVIKAVRTGTGRTFEQDPTMAFRVLVDIALRALSPAINDPTTAVQVLDCEEDLLRMLADRDLDAGEVTGPQGRTRVLLALPGWDDYVALAVDEIVEAGGDNVRIRRRVKRLLRDLIALAAESRRAPLQSRMHDLQARWPAPDAGAGSLTPGRS
jgi:uncharacterized membrane protein